MMCYFKVLVILLLACAIHCDSSVTVQNGSNSFDLKKHYCGKLLSSALEEVCIGPVETPADGGILKKIMNGRGTSRYLVNQCCIKKCSKNFIKSKCPGTRTLPMFEVVSSATTNHTTTPLPTSATTQQPTTTPLPTSTISPLPIVESTTPLITTTTPPPLVEFTNPLITTTTHQHTTTTTTKSTLWDVWTKLPAQLGMVS